MQLEENQDEEGFVDVNLQADYNAISREIGGTLVNLCVMYSNIGKHEIALNFSLRANKLLESLFKNEVTIDDKKKDKDEMTESNFNLVQTLASSYHNTGVELEHLKDH